MLRCCLSLLIMPLLGVNEQGDSAVPFVMGAQPAWKTRGVAFPALAIGGTAGMFNSLKYSKCAHNVISCLCTHIYRAC
jgi:hypothetical protein